MSTVNDIIDLSIRGLEQEEALSDALLERDISTGELDRMKTELTEAKDSKTSLETSLGANSAKRTRFYLSRVEDGARASKFPRSLDAALSRNETLKEIYDFVRVVAANSDAQAALLAEQLVLMRSQVRSTEVQFDELRVLHARCVEKDSRIAEFFDQVDIIEHREVQAQNALTAGQCSIASEVMEKARVRSLLTRFRQTVAGISVNVDSAPDARGNFIAE